MGSREDNPLDGLIRRSLAGEAPREECPAPQHAAAYSERTLGAEETSQFEEHLARCGRCRELLAAIVRSKAHAEELEEVTVPMAGAAAPVAATTVPHRPSERAATARAASEKDLEKPRRWMFDWRWLAPVAAVAIFGIVFFAHYSVRRVAPITSERQLALSKSEPVPSQDLDRALQGSPATGAPSAPAASESANPERRDAGKPRTAQKKSAPQNSPMMTRNYAVVAPTDGAKAEASRSAESPGAEAALKAGRAAGAAAGVSGGFGAGARPKAAAPPPTPKAAQEHADANPAPSAVPSPERQNETVQVQTQGNIIEPTQQQQRAELKQQEALTDELEESSKAANQRAKRAQVTHAKVISLSITIPTPDSKVIYRIAEAGFVERSTDAGATWEGQLVSPNFELTAGDAPAAKICWVVGRAGAVFRTADGANWRKLPPPAIVDLTAVKARDASTATVTAADGRKFSTENAGKAWEVVVVP